MGTPTSHRRLCLLAAGLATATALTLVPTMQSASADPAPDPTGYAAADYVTTGSIKPQLSMGGIVGGLFDFILTPVLSGLVNPLMAAVGNLPRQIAESLAAMVNNSGLTASNPVKTDQPDVLFNTCDNSFLGASQSNPYCYQMFNGGIPPNPLLTVDYQQTAGWTVTDTSVPAQPVRAQAHTNALKITVLGIPLTLNANAVAEVSCPTVTGDAPTASATMRDVQMLGGLVQAVTADTTTGWSQVTFNNQVVAASDTWNTAVFGGNPVEMKFDGNGIWLKLAIQPYALFNTLALNIAPDLLKLIAPDADISFQAFMGPGKTVAGDSAASAWGSNWGFDLSANLSIGIAGLGTINFLIPSGITTDGGMPTGGNLLGMKISYAACGTGVQQPADAIPPGVN